MPAGPSGPASPRACEVVIVSTSLAALVPYRGWRRSLLGLLAALALLVAFPAAAHARPPTVSVTTTGNDTTCTRAGGPCATLARAVDVATDRRHRPVRPRPVQHLGRRHVHQEPDLPRRQSGRPRQPARPRQSREETVLSDAATPAGAEWSRRRTSWSTGSCSPATRTATASGPTAGQEPSTTAGTRSATTSSLATAPGCTSATGSTSVVSQTTCSRQRAPGSDEPSGTASTPTTPPSTSRSPTTSSARTPCRLSLRARAGR